MPAPLLFHPTLTTILVVDIETRGGLRVFQDAVPKSHSSGCSLRLYEGPWGHRGNGNNPRPLAWRWYRMGVYGCQMKSTW